MNDQRKHELDVLAAQLADVIRAARREGAEEMRERAKEELRERSEHFNDKAASQPEAADFWCERRDEARCCADVVAALPLEPKEEPSRE